MNQNQLDLSPFRAVCMTFESDGMWIAQLSDGQGLHLADAVAGSFVDAENAVLAGTELERDEVAFVNEDSALWELLSMFVLGMRELEELRKKVEPKTR